MRQWKTPLVLLLTAALIVTGMFLPRIVSAAGDLVDGGKAGSAPMQSVSLEFSPVEERQAGYMLQKLALEQNLNYFTVAPEGASMTEDEVFEAVNALMDQYVAAGIFRWFPETARDAQPYLAVSADDAYNSGIIWAVNLTKEDDPYHNLFLHLDDETGKIIYVDYVNHDPDSYLCDPGDADYDNQLWDALGTLADIFFEQLELTEQAAFAEASGSNVEYTNAAAEGSSAVYHFYDTQYGEVTVEFVTRCNGFYIVFPN